MRLEFAGNTYPPVGSGMDTTSFGYKHKVANLKDYDAAQSWTKDKIKLIAKGNQKFELGDLIEAREGNRTALGRVIGQEHNKGGGKLRLGWLETWRRERWGHLQPCLQRLPIRA